MIARLALDNVDDPDDFDQIVVLVGKAKSIGPAHMSTFQSFSFTREELEEEENEPDSK